MEHKEKSVNIIFVPPDIWTFAATQIEIDLKLPFRGDDNKRKQKGYKVMRDLLEKRQQILRDQWRQQIQKNR